MDLLDSNRFGQSRVNDAGIVLDQDELTFIGKDGVILLNQAVNFCLEMRLQMGEVKVLTELLTMYFFLLYTMWKRGSISSSLGVGCVHLHRIVPPSMLCRRELNSLD